MLNNVDIIIIKLLNKRFPTAAPGPLSHSAIKGYCVIELCDYSVALPQIGMMLCEQVKHTENSQLHRSKAVVTLFTQIVFEIKTWCFAR